MQGPEIPMAFFRSPENKQISQLCRVCGQRAAGFHFGVFTCEGCKSFFGRTYNNLSAVYGCKNGGRCVINMETRTSCKPCRLKKCLMVGMSKNGSRYGRRSNWFKIHCMFEEQNNLSRTQNGNDNTQHLINLDISKSNIEEIGSRANFPMPFQTANFKSQENMPHVDNELRAMQLKMMNTSATIQDSHISPAINPLNLMNPMRNPMFGHHLGLSPLYISQLLGKPIQNTTPSDLQTSQSPSSPPSSSAAPLTPPLEVDDSSSSSTSPPNMIPLLPLHFQEEFMHNLHMQRIFWNRKRNSDSVQEDDSYHIEFPNYRTCEDNEAVEQETPIDLSVKRPRYTVGSPERCLPESPPSTPVQIPLSVVDTPIDLSIKA